MSSVPRVSRRGCWSSICLFIALFRVELVISVRIPNVLTSVRADSGHFESSISHERSGVDNYLSVLMLRGDDFLVAATPRQEIFGLVGEPGGIFVREIILADNRRAVGPAPVVPLFPERHP